MPNFLLQWLTFLPVLALAVVPAWLGIHFRDFLYYLGCIVFFAVVALVWLHQARKQPDQNDD
ncbi:hypothetical protein N4R57_20250 [Rhodobacteraceae bacterium D3-12]|nr:hypothetical protein N4R57_20250 [Rhodobacteraceae bacterium D3-12]